MGSSSSSSSGIGNKWAVANDFNRNKSNRFQIVEARYYYLNMNQATGGFIDAYKNDPTFPGWLKVVTFPHFAVFGTIHAAGQVAANVVSLGSNNEHWYIVMRNLTQNWDFAIEFSSSGIGLRNIGAMRQPNFHLDSVRPYRVVRGAEEVANWVSGYDENYNVATNNCQTFVKALCRFM